jgi:hypothetical protein
MDVESTVRMGFLPGLPAQGPEIHPRKLPAYLLGFRPVRSKLAKNPSNGNKFQDQQIQIVILTIQTFLKI